jgi:hypothetical protein
MSLPERVSSSSSAQEPEGATCVAFDTLWCYSPSTLPIKPPTHVIIAADSLQLPGANATRFAYAQVCQPAQWLERPPTYARPGPAPFLLRPLGGSGPLCLVGEALLRLDQWLEVLLQQRTSRVGSKALLCASVMMLNSGIKQPELRSKVPAPARHHLR